MYNHQPLEETELSDGEVGVVHGLPPFLAADAYADLRFLDHSHVVGTVSDGECDRFGHETLLYELDDHLLLFGANTTRKYRATAAADP